MAPSCAGAPPPFTPGAKWGMGDRAGQADADSRVSAADTRKTCSTAASSTDWVALATSPIPVFDHDHDGCVIRTTPTGGGLTQIGDGGKRDTNGGMLAKHFRVQGQDSHEVPGFLGDFVPLMHKKVFKGERVAWYRRTSRLADLQP